MKTQDVYIGNTSTNGIYKYKFKNGELIKADKKKKSQTRVFERCTYLNKKKKYLYSVVEKEDGIIVEYQREQNGLKYIEKNLSYGKGPCHIEIAPKNNLLFVSNYIDGYYTIFKINANGTIGNPIYHKIENKKKSHAHCIKVASNGKFFCVVDLGADLLIVYEIKNNIIKEVDRLKFKNNTEPRHIAICKNIIYLITEKSCELYTIRFKNNKLEILDVKSLLPQNIKIKDNYTGCAIKVTKDFKNIYTTIRGHNSISVFKIKNNKAEMVQNINCGGDLPRDLELDKAENYVLVANSDDNKISIFRRDKKSGKLEFKNSEETESPTCVAIDR